MKSWTQPRDAARIARDGRAPQRFGGRFRGRFRGRSRPGDGASAGTLFGLCLVAGLALCACRSGGPRSSGILGDRSVFEQRNDDLLVHQAVSEEEFRKYRRVLLEPVLIYLDPGSEWTQVSPSGQRRFKKALRDALKRELSASFEVVYDPGMAAEDVVIVRAAITDVTTPEEGRQGSEFASSTVEVELLDAVTRKRLMAVIARSRARQATDTVEERQQEAQYIVDGWARALREWLDEVTGNAS